MELKVLEKPEIKTNNTEFKSRSFEIGDATMVIEILRKKLYSNPIQTLVQEYISNARDANREAKATKPIEIQCPTGEDLTLYIRDFGPGLSPERVAEIFVKYGCSTKRGTNTQTGGFGIGAKSAWAYTDSFTVVSHYEGKAYHYIAHVNKEHTGSLDLISTNDSAEPNGVQIQIPVKADDLESFQDAIRRAVKFWDTSEYPKFAEDDFTRVETVARLGQFEAYRNGGEGAQDLFIVIDGIPYPMTEDFKEMDMVKELDAILNGTGALHFKTGEIEVSASREAITVNDANQAAIERAAKDARIAIEKHLRSEITSQKTLHAALAIHLELEGHFKHIQDYAVKYNGDMFTIRLGGIIESDLFAELEILKFAKEEDSRYRGRRSRDNGKEKHKSTDCDFRQYLWLYADDDTSYANQLRRMNATGQTVRLIQNVGGGPNPILSKLAAHLNIQPSSITGAASMRRALKKEGAADVILNHYVKPTSRQTTGKVVNTALNRTTYVYAVRKGDDNANESYKAINYLIDACGLSFALVSESNAKHLKGNAKFISFEDFARDFRKYVLKDKHETFLNTLKQVILGDDYYNPHNTELYAALEKESLKDAILVKAVEVLSRYDSDKTFKSEDYKLNRELNHEHAPVKALIQGTPELKEYAEQEKVMQDLKKTYPLLHAIESIEVNGKPAAPALACYLNAAYKKAA